MNKFCRHELELIGKIGRAGHRPHEIGIIAHFNADADLPPIGQPVERVLPHVTNAGCGQGICRPNWGNGIPR